MGEFGRKNIVLLGIIIYTIATLVFGLAAYCSNISTFFLVSAFARMIQGVADAIINVSLPSILCQEFPERKDTMIGLYAMSLGTGLALGPVFGSLFYSWLGYKGAFYLFSLILGVFGGACVLVLPARINNNEAEN